VPSGMLRIDVRTILDCVVGIHLGQWWKRSVGDLRGLRRLCQEPIPGGLLPNGSISVEITSPSRSRSSDSLPTTREEINQSCRGRASKATALLTVWLL